MTETISKVLLGKEMVLVYVEVLLGIHMHWMTP